MAETDRHEPQIYQLRVVLRGISPLIWRRLLVRSDNTVAQLHEVLQIAFGWDDEHLNRFEMRGREYSVYHDGGGMIGIDATKVRLCDLNLRRLERFVYEYDFGDSWIHDLRLETTLPVNPRNTYPLCVAGKCSAPPEDCGGPGGFMANRRYFAGFDRRQSDEDLEDCMDALPLGIPIQTIERSCDRIEDVGLRPAEAKAILSGLQEQLVSQQLADHLQRHRPCPCCHRPRTIKRYHLLRFRSPFGDMELRSPRWYECDCEGRPAKATFSPLNKILTTHTAPELEFLQAKWAAHLSFAAVVDLLHDVLPVDPCLQVETVRRHVFATAERLEAELGPEQFAYDAGCQLEIEASPEPGPPITVGLDGGHIRGRERRPGATGCFEVIAGKSIPEEDAAKVFAGVRRVDTKPKRRLHEVLRSQGVLPRQHVTFLSDGGDTVRELPAYPHPNCEHILDWFHIGMRVEQLSQMARGFRGTYNCLIAKETILKELERAKWFLWHGNVFRADETLTDLMFEVDGAIEEDREARRAAHLPSSQGRLPVPSPLRTVLDTFASHGSSLTKAS